MRDDDSKYLADLTATCEQQSAAFAERQQLCVDEMAAVEKAIEIRSSVTAACPDEDCSFSVAGRGANPESAPRGCVSQGAGSKINSRVLSALAMRVSEDPFKNVKKMIKDLIAKLME